jgi:hypothetical protein
MSQEPASRLQTGRQRPACFPARMLHGEQEVTDLSCFLSFFSVLQCQRARVATLISVVETDWVILADVGRTKFIFL